MPAYTLFIMRVCSKLLRTFNLFPLAVCGMIGIFACCNLDSQTLPDSATSGQASSQSAEDPASNQVEPPENVGILESEPGEVIIDGRTVLKVYQRFGSITPQDRAEKIKERIVDVAKRGADPNSITTTPRPMWTEISAAGQLLLAVSDEDAQAAGKSRAALAAQNVESIRQALINYRREHNLAALLRGIAYSFLATIVLIPMAFFVRKLRLILRRYLEEWIDQRKTHADKTALHIAFTYSGSMILAVGSVLRWLVLIALFEVYVTVIFSFFPQTRAFSEAVTGWITGALQSVGRSVLAYLPNLFVVAVIIIVALQLSRLIAMIFGEIGNGTLSIRGFYPEWADPSAKLVRMLVLALMIVVIFPYLPGSKSPAFQGISIFVGVLLSLGSSSAVANVIAGIILTYMRSFSVGDWVKIGDTVGEVEERNLLVTRILTPKHEMITIPNATVMSGVVLNFTREAKNAGVIFHTTVTIGYDAPWKIVHQLLIDAALATEHVLPNPLPFVLQTALNDFYVTYELNAYTDYPRKMQFIYSELHQNIQDRFNEAGVEICSPHFASLRDGNSIAIPHQYIARGYAPPAFHVGVDEKESKEATTSGR